MRSPSRPAPNQFKVFMTRQLRAALADEVTLRRANGLPGPNCSAVIRDAARSYAGPPDPVLELSRKTVAPVCVSLPLDSPFPVTSAYIRAALTWYLAIPPAARPRGTPEQQQ